MYVEENNFLFALPSLNQLATNWHLLMDLKLELVWAQNPFSSKAEFR